MLRLSHRNAFALIVFVAAFLGSTSFAAVPRLDDEAPGPIVSRDWRGGPVSLPIGRGHSASEILGASLQLPQTQELVASFMARGYIRRPDQDRAGSSDSVAFAYLAWQKPGVPTTSESPLIRILSKSYFDSDAGRSVVATQSFAGVLRDSSGTLATTTTGSDAPIVIGEVVPLGTPGAIAIDRSKLPQLDNDVWAYRMAYRDGPGGVGTMYKDAVKAACPWVRTITRYTFVGGMAALSTAVGSTGNVWGAVGMALAGEAGKQWIDAKCKCN